MPGPQTEVPPVQNLIVTFFLHGKNVHGQSVLTQTMKTGDAFSTIMIPAAGRLSARRACIAIGGMGVPTPIIDSSSL